MAWRVHDPGDVANTLWEAATDADSADELIDSLSAIAARYTGGYSISFEDAAYQVAGEALDWWPHGSPRTILWTPDVVAGILYQDNVPLVSTYVAEHWERCENWRDGLKLIDEAALGTAILQMESKLSGSADSFPDESEADQLSNRLGAEWYGVFDIDATSRHGPIRRAGALRELATRFSDEQGVSENAAIERLVRTYTDAQDTTIVFYEAMNLHWDPYSNPLDEHFANAWTTDIDALSWLRQVATIVMKWKLTEEASDIESHLDIFGR